MGGSRRESDLDKLEPSITGTGPVISSFEFECGALIGEFRVLSLLGRGASSAVYRATQEGLERDVAIKVLSDSDELRKQRLLREAKSISLVRHPNVVSVYSVGELGDGRVYMVMELVVGRALAQAISMEQARPVHVKNIAQAICAGLAEVHAAGITHRDLKPGNILLPDSGNPPAMLADFGIASGVATDGAQALTGTGVILGTPQYMSPEQCLGKTVDWRSDIYSLGCILYELITGKPPFSADSAYAVMTSHVESRMLFPEGTNRDWIGVIERCTRKDPADRFQSVAELAEAISKLQEPAPKKNKRVPPMRFVVSGIVIAVSAISWLCFGSLKNREGDREQAKALVQQANILVRKRDGNAAFEMAKKASSLDPTNAEARVIMALNRPVGPEAVEDLTRALELEPDNERYRFERARIFFEVGALQKARDDFEKVNLSDRKGYEKDYFVSMIDLQERKFEDAITSSTRLLEKSTKSADGATIRGMARAATGDYPGAIQDFNRGIYLFDLWEETHPDLHHNVHYRGKKGAFLGRAYVYSRMGDRAKCMKDLDEAKKFNELLHRYVPAEIAAMEKS